MDFYEALKERAWFKLRRGKDLGEYNEVIEKLAIGPRNGVIATIEALKEMMVGEPISAIVEIQARGPCEETWIKAHPMKMSCDAEVWFAGWQAPMDDGVVVMVFRMGTGKGEEK